MKYSITCLLREQLLQKTSQNKSGSPSMKRIFLFKQFVMSRLIFPMHPTSDFVGGGEVASGFVCEID